MEDVSDYGPAMQALTAPMRRFVIEVLENPSLDNSAAYRRAYPEAKSPNGIAVNAHRLAHNSKVLDALHEEARKRMRSSAVLGASVLVEIAASPGHKDRLKAAGMLLNRIGLHETTEVIRRDERPTDELSMVERIVELAKTLGVDPRKLLGQNAPALALLDQLEGPQPVTIEATAEESSTEGLEDVL